MSLPIQFLDIFVWNVTKTIIKFSYSIRFKPNQCLAPSTIEKVSVGKLYKYNQLFCCELNFSFSYARFCISQLM